MSKPLLLTGIVGLVAALLTGVGEYLLHYDSQARFSTENYDFMLGISDNRTTIGHFFGVFGGALYTVGFYHIYLMLKPANGRASFLVFLVGAFGCIIGAVWIGSRASISALAQLSEVPELLPLIELYQTRYETLLNITRITTLFVSVVLVWLTLTGRSLYSKWIALFNPILLIIASFVIYLIAPNVGKHMMPIALNVAFTVFFTLSIFQAYLHSSNKGPS